jgi:hypothetical protein
MSANTTGGRSLMGLKSGNGNECEEGAAKTSLRKRIGGGKET